VEGGGMSELAQVFDFGAARERRQARASEPWLNRRQIAAHLGVSVRTVERWCAERGMPSHKRFEHGHVKFRRSEVDDWYTGRDS
jgi:excisionase family DNA binding protein